MKKRMQITLAALVSIATGCTGQTVPEVIDEAPTTSAAVVPYQLGLSAYLYRPPTEIVYDLDSRFLLTVTKERLRSAKTIHDIAPEQLKQEMVSYTSVSIRTVEGEDQPGIIAAGTGPILSPEQLKLLQSLDYSDHFVIDAKYTMENAANGRSSWDRVTPHVTIVPEHEAANSLGREAMIAHVRHGTSAFPYMVDAYTLRAGKVHFTVNKEGTISNVRLLGSSGYPALDKRVLQLLHTLPGTWEPATNAAGEPVDQEFVFSFGTMGC